MIVTVFKDLLKSKDVPFHVPIDKIINRIKKGTSKELIEKIKNNPSQKDQLKRKLPCILFAGTFTERNSKSCTEHSGLMILDYDKFLTPEDFNNTFDFLKNNIHIFAIFKSPSGYLKAVLKVSKLLDRETHPKVFKQFNVDFNNEFFDISNSNIDRVCFESYDPDIYVNYNAVDYTPNIEDKGFRVDERASLIPITDEDKIIDFIMRWNWKKDFREGERNAFIFDVAGAFCEYGISQTTAENYIINNVIIGDFSDVEAKRTIKSAYRNRQFNIKYFEDYKKIEKVKNDLKKDKKTVLKNHKIDEEVYNEIKQELEHEDFWYFDDKGKCKLDNFKYKIFLERNGFKKVFQNESVSPTFVYIESNKVEESSADKIKDFVLSYLLDKGEIDVWKYCTSFANMFADKFLTCLDTIHLTMLKDKRDKSFIAFNNGILEVGKNEVNLIDYIDIDDYVWKSQIIQRDFVKDDDFENEYKTFINNISNDEPLAIECVIGYLLTNYKNKMNNKAIILNDEVISENPEGGTGKGLFVQGLKQIRKVSILDGKSFDDKKSFPYQTVNIETEILVFDDVKKNFDFENKFSLVTEGLTLERKNKDAIKLTVEQSPKMVLSTNYAIKGEGNSHDRRRHEIEIAQYYNGKLTPFDEFGRQLFDDWSEEDFIKFDNYMVWCIQTFLSNGLISQNAKNIRLRKFIAESSMEFYEWVQDSENVPLNIMLDKKEYLNKFVDEYQDFKKWLTAKRFNIWVQKYCKFTNQKYLEGNTNGFRWFMIENENVQTDDNNDIAF
jgi:hypothetical protein